MSDLKLAKLIEAVKNSNFTEVEKLVKAGVDINQQDEHGWTPLNYAAGKGNLPMVQFLLENGADLFRAGRDQRFPYDISLAAGRVSVAKYLKEAEARYSGEKPYRPQRKYCKAFQLRDLRKYPAWSEKRINWKKAEEGVKGDCPAQTDELFPDEKIVYIHQDFTVTESIWHDTNIIFDQVDSAWIEFCATNLNFKALDDLDLIVANEPDDLIAT